MARKTRGITFDPVFLTVAGFRAMAEKARDIRDGYAAMSFSHYRAWDNLAIQLARRADEIARERDCLENVSQGLNDSPTRGVLLP